MWYREYLSNETGLGRIMSKSTTNQTGRDLNMGRDSSWLIGADIFAVFLALIGQVVLTRALITEDYGIFIIALDVFATTFLIIDLGLPTILTRDDGANCVNKIWEAIWRIYRIQFICMIPFVVIALLGVTIIVDDWTAFFPGNCDLYVSSTSPHFLLCTKIWFAGCWLCMDGGMYKSH